MESAGRGPTRRETSGSLHACQCALSCRAASNLLARSRIWNNETAARGLLFLLFKKN